MDWNVEVEGGAVPAVLTEGGDAPAVLIVPAIFGITDGVRARVEEYAATGHTACAVDPFWREDPGVIPFSDFKRGLARARAVAAPRLQADLRAVIGALKQRGDGRVVMIGVCFGGRYAWWAAARGEVDGIATWHGGSLGQELHLSTMVRCPAQMDFGDADPSIPVEEVRRIGASLAHNPAAEIRIHPGARHGFTQRGASAFQAEANAAAEDGVRRMLAALG